MVLLDTEQNVISMPEKKKTIQISAADFVALPPVERQVYFRNLTLQYVDRIVDMKEYIQFQKDVDELEKKIDFSKPYTA